MRFRVPSLFTVFCLLKMFFCKSQGIAETDVLFYEVHSWKFWQMSIYEDCLEVLQLALVNRKSVSVSEEIPHFFAADINIE